MRYTNLGKFKSITPYVNDKLSRLEKLEPSFDNLFSIMFEDESNTFFEESSSYKIKKITYGEAKDKVDIISKNISKKYPGVPINSVIGIYLDNSDLWIETFWAILKSGFRPLLLNMRLNDESLEYSLDILNVIGVISKDKIFNVPTLLESELLLENEGDNNHHDFGNEFFVMSSGTSEKIKICAYTALEVKNILLQSRAIINSSKAIKKHYNGELKLLTFLPFYHIFGFVAVYLWFSFYGRTFVKLNDLNPTTIQNTIRRHHVTHIFAVPLLWQKTYEAAIKEIKNRGEKTYHKFEKGMTLVNKPVIGPFIKKFAFKQIRNGLFGESISYLIAGGSVIDSKVVTFFNSIGYHLSTGYGMSEIGITSVELSSKDKILNSCSVGNPLPGVSYLIQDDGVLMVKGNTLASYIIEDEKVKRNNGDYFLTKDLAKFENGRYYILGREDDLVVSITGENLNPNLIEKKLLVNNVNEVCLINSPDHQMPILLVSINRYTSKEKYEEIFKNLKLKIVENNLSSQIGKVDFVVDSFIKENDFKVNRKKIEKDYFSGLLSRYEIKNEPNNEEDDIAKRIKEYFAVALNLNTDDIHYESDFFLDHGGNSLDYFAMISRIESEFNVSFPKDKPLNSIKDIHDFIKENL